MANVTCELIWLIALLRDFGIQSKEPTTLFCDNETTLHIAANPVFHEMTKHIEIDCHLVREKIQAGCLKTMNVSSQHQLVDLFIKALFPAQFKYLPSKMGIHNLHSPFWGVLKHIGIFVIKTGSTLDYYPLVVITISLFFFCFFFYFLLSKLRISYGLLL